MRRWSSNLDHVDPHIKDLVDALAALCISKPGDVAAAAIEMHAKSPCILYLASSSDIASPLESHFQILWRSLRQVAPVTSSTSPSLESPATDFAAAVYDFSWAIFHERFAPDFADYFVDRFIPQVTVTTIDIIKDDERRDLQRIGNLFDTLRKAITCSKPANGDMKSIVSALSLLSTTLQPYLDDFEDDSLIHQCCNIAFHRPIQALLDIARSTATRSMFTQPLRVVQIPSTRLPFRVDMRDNYVMSLWKEHKGMESFREDLDAQWNQCIIDNMQCMLDTHKKDVTNISTDGGMILSALTRPHSACALLAYLANLADASPYPYIGLSCEHPCYACYAFFSAYNRADPKLPFYIQSPRYQFYIPLLSLHSPITISTT
ncbi:hypothetical protein HETIRDRAFT_106151 [Heterobasidion irregulare TC 32-1]|uniref:Uncharacterized protein n=1 Tax=Heterobasidion irregulare (strain TC 32-1) TaxID=747525 RepID=W4JT59_HETIT|nr:uncharacterized protein HETIRDRAFT_106151 [Heterobasidion irregulare TC 32-1]ETW76747.1 hypothetical protein HETIRDRAFT_106151 [Heterobasidion irregulare TC 32-1]